MKRMKRIVSGMSVFLLVALLWSCAGMTRQERAGATGTAIGAGVGAILGQAIGRNTGATILGATVGAALGGIGGGEVGGYMDRQEQELRRAVAASEEAGVRRTKEVAAAAEAANVQRTQDILTATFRSEVLFDFDSAELKAGANTELARVASVLKKYPQTTIRVEGHTDGKGSDAYNQELSKRRADAVRTALIQQGIDPSRIEAVGLGETRPISSNDAMNRRVTIVIQPTVKAVG